MYNVCWGPGLFRYRLCIFVVGMRVCRFLINLWCGGCYVCNGLQDRQACQLSIPYCVLEFAVVPVFLVCCLRQMKSSVPPLIFLYSVLPCQPVTVWGLSVLRFPSLCWLLVVAVRPLLSRSRVFLRWCLVHMAFCGGGRNLCCGMQCQCACLSHLVWRWWWWWHAGPGRVLGSKIWSKFLLGICSFPNLWVLCSPPRLSHCPDSLVVPVGCFGMRCVNGAAELCPLRLIPLMPKPKVSPSPFYVVTFFIL